MSKNSRQLENDFAIFTVLVIVACIAVYHGMDETTKRIINGYIIAIIGIFITVAVTGALYYLNEKRKKDRKKEIQKFIELKKISVQKQQKLKQKQNEQNEIIEKRIIERKIVKRAIFEMEIVEKQTFGGEKQSMPENSECFVVESRPVQMPPITPKTGNSNMIVFPTPNAIKNNNLKKRLIPDPISKTPILTNTENHFKKYLLEAKPKNLHINYKTRLADVVSDILIYSKFQDRILQMHLDFILIDNDGNIILAIELDDSSHNLPKNKERDEIKNEILEKAEIPILRVKVQKNYKSDELKTDIENKIKSRLIRNE